MGVWFDLLEMSLLDVCAGVCRAAVMCPRPPNTISALWCPACFSRLFCYWNTTFTRGPLSVCLFVCWLHAGCCYFGLRFVSLYEALIFLSRWVNIKKVKEGLERWLSSQIVKGIYCSSRRAVLCFPEGVPRTHYFPLLQIQRIWYSQLPVHTCVCVRACLLPPQVVLTRPPRPSIGSVCSSHSY